MFWFITSVCLAATYYFLRRAVHEDRMQQDVIQSYTRAVDALDDSPSIRGSRRSNGR